MTKDYKIPWKDGQPVVYVSNWDGHTVEWRDNEPLVLRLEFKGFVRGRSAARSVFTDTESGITFEVFLKDLEGIIPHLLGGRVHGVFSFRKRGTNYGLALDGITFQDACVLADNE